jgi:hypothetical protein
MEATLEIDGYPSFVEMPTSADKILWILEKAKSNGIEKLNQK